MHQLVGLPAHKPILTSQDSFYEEITANRYLDLALVCKFALSYTLLKVWHKSKRSIPI